MNEITKWKTTKISLKEIKYDKDIPWSLTGRFNIVKMSIPPN